MNSADWLVLFLVTISAIANTYTLIKFRRQRRP
jgi:hypothetical protein